MKKFIICIFSILTFFILSEFITRLIFVFKKSNNSNSSNISQPCYYKLVPYMMFKIEPNFHSQFININSLGFRGKEFNPQKPKNVFRIFVVGGSVVLGAAVSDDKTFTHILENMLNRNSKQKQIEVINAGRSSYLSAQELISIQMEIIDYQPDLIILFDGLNDLHHAVVYDRRPGYPYLFDMIERSCGQAPLKRYFILGLSRGIQWLAQKSKFIGILDTNLKKIIKKEPIYEPNFPVIDFYKHNLDLIAIICKAKNIKLFMCPQPFLGTKKYLSDEEKKRAPGNYLEVMREMYKKLLVSAEEVARKNKVNFANLTDVFDNETGTIYYDVAHFGEKGHRLIAERLYNEIKLQHLIP